MDLFSVALESVTWKELESFLGLTLPEDQRLREGEKIDFKEQFPQELGEIVAGLCNASGGLIFIGIKADKKKHNVPVAWDGISIQPDLETRATAKILSTVRPKPNFQVHAVSTGTGRAILIVRVGEGSYPPYEYEQGNTVRIPTRVNDTLRQANVREIEALIEKRAASVPLSEQAILQYINAPGFDCTNSNGIQETEFQRIVIVPKGGVGCGWTVISRKTSSYGY